MSAALPVRVLPQPEESVPSILHRLSLATGIPLTELHRAPMSNLLTPPEPGPVPRRCGPCRSLAAEWDQAATTLDLPSQQLIRNHSLGGDRSYGRPVIDVAAFHLRDPAGLICSRCHYTQIWAHLTLVTSCTNCGLLLTTEPTNVSHASLASRQMQNEYLAGIRGHKWIDRDRIRRLWRLFEHSLCAIGSALDLHLPTAPPRSSVRSAQAVTGRHATFEPSWISSLADHIWPASRSNQETHAFIVQRLHGATPGGIDHGQRAGASLEVNRRQLHETLRQHALVPADVPDLMMSSHRFGTARCHLEGVAYATALALRFEASAAHGNHAAASLNSAVVPSEMWPSWDIRGLADHLTQTPDGLALLQHEARALASAPHRTHQPTRRAALRQLHHVPSDVLLRAGVPADPKTGRVAAAWIWLEGGLGTWSTGPHSRALRGQVQRFDEGLTPEGAMHLLEHASAFAGAVESDISLEVARHPQSPARFVSDAG